ncbi:MAG: tyrosine-type recombinase/integrase [Candidatus Bathyarchaeia archaeon]
MGTPRRRWDARMIALRYDASPEEDFEVAIGLFLTRLKVKNDSPLTINWYRERLTHFAKFAEARSETPATFSRETIEAFLLEKSKRIKPTSVNRYLAAIRTFCNFMRKEGIRHDNPTDGIEKLQEPLYYPRTLSDEQIVSLINTISEYSHTFVGLRDLTLVSLLLNTGLRISEALNLTFNDVDVAQRFVRVVGKRQREWFVPIGENVRVLLVRYLAKRLKVRTGDWLFITTLGRKISRREARKIIATWTKRAGIGGVRISPHSLRFTFIRKWLQLEDDSLVLQPNTRAQLIGGNKLLC